MNPLDKTLRSRLERTVRDGREAAEAAARAALDQLGVGESAPYAHLGEQDRELRRRLRIHGRQLGDSLNSGTIQTMDRLIEEVAYEHWHRMLFARFLAENNLLMYEDVAITLEECEELASDEGARNGWEFAAGCAASMLPQIFRLESPVFQLVLPPEHQQKLERLVADLPVEVFTASDSLGWVYQFWQAKRKDEVNASEVKIGARELPAVTQLFTEPYMVSFLLDNSLGAWWAARRLTEADVQSASSEEELRHKAAIPGVPLEFLRFVKEEDGTWQPAAGRFEGWPEHLADLKTLDPCCGSGHFLVAAFLMLVPMRMQLEGLSAQHAVDAVLRQNIHGLELDQRCVELAAFALALAAWTYPNAGGYRALPALNVACSGVAVSASKDEWRSLAGRNHNLRIALDWMHDTFQDAPVLGSLLNPTSTEAAKLVQWDELSSALEQALRQEQPEEQQEIAVAAHGLAKAASLLAGNYHWVVTNVPYLARGKHSDRLRKYCERHYSAGKNDLATVFLDRCLEFCAQGGTSSIVLPQNWLFLTSYKKFREKLLKSDTWHLIARLGSGAFETISGEVVKAILITLSRGSSAKESGGLFGEAVDSNLIRGVDVSEPRTAAEKAAQLLSAEIKSVEQAKQLNRKNSIVGFTNSADVGVTLDRYASSLAGSYAGDLSHFNRFHWEIQDFQKKWELLQDSPRKSCHYAGMYGAIMLEKESGEMYKLAESVRHLNHSAQNWLRGKPFWGRMGVTMAVMGELHSGIYNGEVFGANVVVIMPNEPTHLPAIYRFVESGAYRVSLRSVNQGLAVSTNSFLDVEFDLDYWSEQADIHFKGGLPKPYTDDPTQWIFHGHPCGSVVWSEEQKWTTYGPLRTDDSVLHVAVARLLGYRWPAEFDAGMELADEQREWVKRCEALAGYADDDGIVCIPPVRGEASASDRLLNLLAAAYGDAWSNDTLATLLKSADHAGKTLETWLREKFFSQHCKLFQHRPFVWHIWDGLRDGFAILVNYHKLDAKRLETLIYTYLGDWISRQKQDIANGVDGAQERLAAAEALKKKLELIREGETPYDIFVRWKPLEKQPIGWDPDLNDGVRLNIRPFITAEVLRHNKKPHLNISWDKDRGKDVESAPWFHAFNGDRINDHHLRLEEKRKARSGK